MFPNKIKNCPLVDALIEIRFSTNVDKNAVFGLIYSQLADKFGNVQSLPINNIPEPIRLSDPNLLYAPYYKANDICNNNIILQIGPRVITISSSPTYIGWNTFSEYATSIVRKIQNASLSINIERIGLRYINFFANTDIFDKKTKISINLDGEEIQYNQTLLKTEIYNNQYKSIVQLINGGVARIINPQQQQIGSVLDIDTYRVDNLQNAITDFSKIINEAHDEEKRIFVKILSENFLNQLGAE